MHIFKWSTEWHEIWSTLLKLVFMRRKRATKNKDLVNAIAGNHLPNKLHHSM